MVQKVLLHAAKQSLVSMLHYLLASLLRLLKLQMEAVHCTWGSQSCAPAAGPGSARHLQREGHEEKSHPAAQTALSPQPEGVFSPLHTQCSRDRA